MKVVVTTKDFCEEAKRYLESEGLKLRCATGWVSAPGRLTTFCTPW